MTEHKFTDEEVIKALAFHAYGNGHCLECPIRIDGCSSIMASLALKLINRQKAEIEKLKDLNNLLETVITNANMNLEHISYEFDLLKQEKSVVLVETVKAFADRLTNEAQTMQSLKTGAYYRAVTDGQIEKIAREMMEGEGR